MLTYKYTARDPATGKKVSEDTYKVMQKAVDEFKKVFSK